MCMFARVLGKEGKERGRERKTAILYSERGTVFSVCGRERKRQDDSERKKRSLYVFVSQRKGETNVFGAKEINSLFSILSSRS